MSATITVEEARAKLTELIGRLSPGEEIVITKDHEPVAKLVSQRTSGRTPRVPGNCKGMIKLEVEDDEHLKDFEEYMPSGCFSALMPSLSRCRSDYYAVSAS
jgi:prevent-host-death family protein